MAFHYKYTARHPATGHLGLTIIGLLLFLLTLAFGPFTSCTPVTRVTEKPIEPVSVPEPRFTFDAIEVSPQPIIAGEDFIVSVKVTNSGDIPGSYSAALIISGKPEGSSSVYVEPGSSAMLTYTLSIPIPGQYLLRVGSQSREITIPFNRTPSTIQLGPGVADGCDTLAGTTGQWGNMIQNVEGNLIRLTAPPGGFEINSVDIFGFIKSSDNDFNNNSVIGGPGTWVYGSDIAAIEQPNHSFSVNIYDARKTRLFSGDFSKSLFNHSPRWVTVPIPGVPVQGDFFIEVVTHNQPRLSGTGFGSSYYPQYYVVHTWYYQMCVGWEYSMDVQSWVSQNGNVVSDRWLTYNWLIRAAGYRLGRQ